MRLLALSLALAGCTDAADVPTTIARVELAATCTSGECASVLSEIFGGHCGYIVELIEPDTREVTVMTATDAEDIERFVQVQYTDTALPATTPPDHFDHVLQRGESFNVFTAYYTDGLRPLYRLSAAGEVTDVDETRLATTTDNTFVFEYEAIAYDGSTLAASETHVVEAPRPVRIETDDPGITDACCSAGRPADLSLVVLALAGLRRRRRAAPHAR